METKKMMSILLILFALTPGIAQENSKRALREKNRLEKQHEIEALMNAKTFVFVADRALPLGYGSVDLTTNSNSVKFEPEKIDSYMPFFGRAYSIDYGGDGGLKFTGKPDQFTITPLKEGKGFEINASVSAPRDKYTIQLFVSPEGSATMTILSNQRSSISYYGNIGKAEETEEKQSEESRQKNR